MPSTDSLRASKPFALVPLVGFQAGVDSWYQADGTVGRSIAKKTHNADVLRGSSQVMGFCEPRLTIESRWQGASSDMVRPRKATYPRALA